MFMNVTCPTCGHRCRVSEGTLGQQMSCPACGNRFQCGTVSPRSLVTFSVPAVPPAPVPPASVQATPQARAVSVQPAPSIHYRCPRCERSLESPAHLAGQKLSCPGCGQRLQVPVSALPPVARPAASPTLPPREPAAAPVPPRVRAAAPPAHVRRDYCLECGEDVTQRARVQTCPDCGSIFCSAGCYREHHHHAHGR